MSESAPPALSIGVVFGGYDAQMKAWDSELKTLTKQVIALRANVDSPVRVNVVYHVDGKLAPNEFEGIRIGRYSRKDAHLMVQAAVPTGPVPDMRKTLVELLGEAVDAAEVFARERGIADDLSALRRMVDGLSEPSSTR